MKITLIFKKFVNNSEGIFDSIVLKKIEEVDNQKKLYLI